MIYIGFELAWPVKKCQAQLSKDYLYVDGQITKNKSFEFQISKFAYSFPIIGFDFSYRPYQDHAGPRLTIALLGIEFMASLYDNRHWFREEGRWFEPGEEAKLDKEGYWD